MMRRMMNPGFNWFQNLPQHETQTETDSNSSLVGWAAFRLSSSRSLARPVNQVAYITLSIESLLPFLRNFLL
jgi:hypothetical protein